MNRRIRVTLDLVVDPGKWDDMPPGESFAAQGRRLTNAAGAYILARVLLSSDAMLDGRIVTASHGWSATAIHSPAPDEPSCLTPHGRANVITHTTGGIRCHA